MTQKQLRVGVSNIFVDEQGRLLLMKRADQCKSYPSLWGLVAGLMESGESPQEAAKREAKEEIGVDIEVQRFVGRYYCTPSPHYGIVISLPHHSKIIAGTPHAAQPEECSDVRWFSVREVQAMDLAYDHKEILKEEGLI